MNLFLDLAVFCSYTRVFFLDGAEQAIPLQEDKWSNFLEKGSTNKVIQDSSLIVK